MTKPTPYSAYGFRSNYYLQRGSTPELQVPNEEAWCVVGETWELHEFASDDVLVDVGVVAYYRNYQDAENARCALQRRQV